MPKCCEYAQAFIILSYTDFPDTYHDDYHEEAVRHIHPNWMVRGTVQASREPSLTADYSWHDPNITFCPACGTRLPLIIFRPEVTHIQLHDGHYHCITCDLPIDDMLRFPSVFHCQCTPPLDCWQLASDD